MSTPHKNNAPEIDQDQRGVDKTNNTDSKTNHSKPPLKWKRTLNGLLRSSHNRFSAERELHDHCLPSTVAELQARGAIISRRWETVPGYAGAPTRCCRYWVAAEDVKRAQKLLQGV